MKCRECGGEVQEDNKFCQKCGTPIGVETAMGDVPAPPPPPPQPSSQQPPQVVTQPGQQTGYSQELPPPIAPKKMSGTAKGCLISAAIVAGVAIVIVIILFVVIGVGVHKTVEKLGEVTDKKTIEADVGEVADNGPLAIRVVSWKTSPGDDISKPEAGNQFVVIDLEVKNNSTAAVPISRGVGMSIRKPDGTEYDWAGYFPEPNFPDGDIQPGQTARGYMAFEVPTGMGSMTYVYDPYLQVGDIVKVELK